MKEEVKQQVQKASEVNDRLKVIENQNDQMNNRLKVIESYCCESRSKFEAKEKYKHESFMHIVMVGFTSCAVLGGGMIFSFVTIQVLKLFS